MMEKRDNPDELVRARALREDTQVHYNCCQSVLLPFCGRCGLTEAQAMALGTHFGAGMRHGGTCGTVTGALMALGLAGKGEEAAQDLLRAMGTCHGALDCAQLLEKAKADGVERKPYCDRMVYDAVACLQRLLGERPGVPQTTPPNQRME